MLQQTEAQSEFKVHYDNVIRMTSSRCNADREKVQQITEEERALREENLRLQRRLLRETERREQLSRQMSESESSLEMDEERQFNERARFAGSPVSYSPSPTRRSESTVLCCIHVHVYILYHILKLKLQMYSYNGERPWPSLYSKYYRT